MKVLRNNYNNYCNTKPLQKYPQVMICEHCESELEFDKSDIRIGGYGWALVDCPLCGYSNLYNNEDEHLVLTVDNIKFPVHFYNFSSEKSAKDVDDERIEEWIHKGIKYFRENKDRFVWFSASGNTHVSIYRMYEDENYTVIVAKNYYESEIPFEEEDY